MCFMNLLKVFFAMCIIHNAKVNKKNYEKRQQPRYLK